MGKNEAGHLKQSRTVASYGQSPPEICISSTGQWIRFAKRGSKKVAGLVAKNRGHREGDTTMNALKSLILGFLAGVIAAATVQEAISWLFVHYWTGWDAEPWSLRPMPSLLMPQLVLPWLVGSAITAGLWGALFGLILGWKPIGMMTIRGAILGLFGPGLIGAFIVVPHLAHLPSPLLQANVSEIVPILCISAGFGAVTAWLYGLFSWGRTP